MLLYNTTRIKDCFIRKHFEHEQKKEISKFFTLQHMFNNLGVNSIYTNDKSPALFINQSDLSKLCLLASSKFGLEFKYKDMERTSPSLVPVQLDVVDYKKFHVKNFTEVVNVLKVHNVTSSYAVSQNIKKEQERKEKDSLFNRMSNMDRDFSSSRIASIDFEYNPNTTFKNHLNTIFEFGVTIYDKGKIEYHHYLVDEIFVNKKTNPDLQFEFDFGVSKIIPLSEVKSVFKDFLKNTDYLLFHEYSADYGILKNNNLGVEEFKSMDLLDTQMFFKKHFKEELNEKEPVSLKKLLGYFDIESKNLHNSGNDAAYTLLLFLKMVDAYNLKKENEIKLDGVEQSKKHKVTRNVSL